MSRSSVAAPSKAADGTWWFVMDRGPGYDRTGAWRERRQARRKGFATKREAQAAMHQIVADSRMVTDRLSVT